MHIFYHNETLNSKGIERNKAKQISLPENISQTALTIAASLGEKGGEANG